MAFVLRPSIKSLSSGYDSLSLEMRVMSKPRFITLGELCDLLGVGKQTYYKLQRQGYFPEPIRSANGRPFFSAELIEECQTIVRTRCGKNGLPLVLNRRPGSTPAPKKKAVAAKHEDLLAALASLGVQTTPAKVAAVLETLPTDLPEPELIKAVFRELKKQG
jgi:predicted DNA-binding transcriptional regulator AlpA